MPRTVRLRVLKPIMDHKPGDYYEDSAECARAHVALGNAEYASEEQAPARQPAKRAPRKTAAKKAATKRATYATRDLNSESAEDEASGRYNRTDLRAED